MSNIISLHSDGHYRRRAQILFEEGMHFVASKDYVQAKDRFEKAAKFDASVMEYQFYAGVSNYILDHLEIAEGYLKEAIKETPFNAEYHYTYGVVLYRLKKEKRAKDVFEKIVERDASHIDALLYLSKCFVNDAKYDEAIALIEIVIGMDPARHDAYFELGCVYLSIYQLELAERYFKRSMSINRQYAIAYYYLSKVCLKRGEHDRAIFILETLKTECPNEKDLAEKNIQVIEALKNI